MDKFAEKLQLAMDTIIGAGPWAAFALILLAALIVESRANRKVIIHSTAALTALRTVIESRFENPNNQTPDKEA